MTDSERDVIVKELLDLGRNLFPDKAQEMESWLDRQLSAYGLSYARVRGQEIWEKTSINPLVWLGLGIGGILLFKAVSK